MLTWQSTKENKKSINTNHKKTKKLKWKYVFEHGIAINLKALSKWQSKQKCYRLV